MAAAWVPYDCPEDVCKAVQLASAMSERLGAFSARPFKQYEPDETSWWLVPHDEDGSWPAHRLGKFAFEFGSEANELDIGLYVERGLSAQTAEALGHLDHLVLDDEWMWTRFAADVKNGSLAKVVRRLNKTTGLEVYVAFLVKPQAPVGSQSIEGDVVWFSLSDKAWNPTLDPPTSKSLRPFRSATSDTQVAAALENVDRYHWIDAYVVATFACGSKAQTTNVWDAERLCSQLLQPLARWIGSCSG